MVVVHSIDLCEGSDIRERRFSVARRSCGFTAPVEWGRVTGGECGRARGHLRRTGAAQLDSVVLGLVRRYREEQRQAMAIEADRGAHRPRPAAGSRARKASSGLNPQATRRQWALKQGHEAEATEAAPTGAHGFRRVVPMAPCGRGCARNGPRQTRPRWAAACGLSPRAPRRQEGGARCRGGRGGRGGPRRLGSAGLRACGALGLPGRGWPRTALVVLRVWSLLV